MKLREFLEYHGVLDVFIEHVKSGKYKAEKEKWKLVNKYYKGLRYKYFMSNYGRLVSIDNNGKLKYLLGLTNDYLYFTFGRHHRGMPAHRIVAKLFIDEKENEDVNHIYGTKKLNYYKCLEWCSHSKNMKHAHKNSLFKNHGGKKSVIQLDLNFNMIKTFKSVREASIKTGIIISGISRCCRSLGGHDNETHFTANGYRWMFVDDYKDKRKKDTAMLLTKVMKC